jgi:ParB-like chromosome segregation protein Spo0J
MEGPVMTIYQHIRHPRIAARLADGPVKVADLLPRGTAVTFHDASATLHEVAHVQEHLAAQDELLTRIAEKIGLDPVPVIDAPPGDQAAGLSPED